MNEKLSADHLSRKAMLYIRQSSPYQVAHHEESRRLQYAMEDRLRELGWREVEVIDEDLGRTAAGTADRRGFDQMVAQVCLGQVGAVAAREVSRFSPLSREWQTLVEVCRMVNTVLIDHESIYDPRRSNDRLLLGLKGSLNEYELDLLRQRALEARTAKAKRGELIAAVPAGYLKAADGTLEQDPDRRVQQTLRLIFQKIVELGSLRQLLLWMLEHELKIPVRRHDGVAWQTVWRRPSYPSLHRLVTNPVYAGAYAYGKTEVVHQFEDDRPRKRARRRSRDQWIALIRDHHPGYIGWDRFEQVQAMITRNQNGAAGPGAAKRGPALLVGLLRCAQNKIQIV
jgi:DNA invertase Pin-like site-specific DNA recombinase